MAVFVFNLQLCQGSLNVIWIYSSTSNVCRLLWGTHKMLTDWRCSAQVSYVYEHTCIHTQTHSSRLESGGKEGFGRLRRGWRQMGGGGCRGDQTNFLAWKKLLRCCICQKPVRRRRVCAIDYQSTCWFVLSLVWRKRSSRYWNRHFYLNVRQLC